MTRLLHLLHSTASSDLIFYIQPPSAFVFTRFVDKQHCRRPLPLVVQGGRLGAATETPASTRRQQRSGRSPLEIARRKQRRRRIARALAKHLAESQLVGGDFVDHVEDLRSDHAGAPLRAVTEVPSAPAALQNAKRFRRVHVRRMERELTGRGPAPAPLHRPRPALGSELGVDQLREAEPPRQLARDREPGVGGKGGIIGANEDPSAPAVTVNGHHPLGDLHSLPWRLCIPAMIPTRSDRKGPVFPGLF
jgi:hypothetical protein